MTDASTPGVTLGEKVAHVRHAMAGPSDDHDCHWPGCSRSVPPAVWGCRKHWRMLPYAIRSAIWNAFRPGQERTKTPSPAYVEAARAAEAWILKNHPPERKLL